MQTNTNTKIEPITWKSLLATYDKFCKDNPMPTGLKCDPFFYMGLKDFFEKQELEDTIKGVKKAPVSSINNIYGIQIKIDVDMKPGEWRFEYNRPKARSKRST